MQLKKEPRLILTQSMVRVMSVKKCLQEITIATEMGKLGIGPKVYDSYQCKYKNETKYILLWSI